MGFTSGAYAKVWKIDPVSDRMTKLQISISRKDKQTGEYETRFKGFAAVCGSAPAAKARKLSEGDVIKLDRVDVENHWDKEKQKEFTNFFIYSFDPANFNNTPEKPHKSVDEGPESSGDEDDKRLPF